uniref:Uncharacterized protein n=1 Tax=Aplanochytrium stocchinoi TaxID=215587 RepID=A0A7S3PP40_9STRA|mmetsp:Transcript_17134/g.20643  ORF Transcript_17134/g.20643 Transcript_17134/m.20643 type:complete len:271 (+) Transcript_17134:180-992(+)
MLDGHLFFVLMRFYSYFVTVIISYRFIFCYGNENENDELVDFVMEDLLPSSGKIDASMTVQGFPVKVEVDVNYDHESNSIQFGRQDSRSNSKHVNFDSFPSISFSAAEARKRALNSAEAFAERKQQHLYSSSNEYMHRRRENLGLKINNAKRKPESDIGANDEGVSDDDDYVESLEYASLRWIWKDALEVFRSDDEDDAQKLSKVRNNLEVLKAELDTIKEYKDLKRKGETIDDESLKELEISSKQNMMAFRNQLRLSRKEKAKRSSSSE